MPKLDEGIEFVPPKALECQYSGLHLEFRLYRIGRPITPTGVVIQYNPHGIYMTKGGAP